MLDRLTKAPAGITFHACVTIALVLVALTTTIFVAVEVLVPDAEMRSFTIKDDLDEKLVPGLSVPMDLVLTNPHPFPIEITELDVRMGSVEDAHPDADPCDADEFQVTQFAGSYGMRLPARTSHTLGGLGVPRSRWPHLKLIDEQADQDQCKDAKLTFELSGSAKQIR